MKRNLPEIYKTPDCYIKDRGRLSCNLKKGDSITIWTEGSLKIEPRASNSITIRIK